MRSCRSRWHLRSVLRCCTDQLCGIMEHKFNTSLELWKTFFVVSLQKHPSICLPVWHYSGWCLSCTEKQVHFPKEWNIICQWILNCLTGVPKYEDAEQCVQHVGLQSGYSQSSTPNTTDSPSSEDSAIVYSEDDLQYRVNTGLCELVPAEPPPDQCSENQGASSNWWRTIMTLLIIQGPDTMIIVL